MLLTIAEFRSRVSAALHEFISELQETTGRHSPEEADAWINSLPKVSQAFGAPIFQPLHLYFGERGNLSLEYRLPAASSWCDMVLLGSHKNKPAAVIVELKDWVTRSDRPGPVEGLMVRHIGPALHPSDQVRGYTEYCRRFHSGVLDAHADVYGCVLFTRDTMFGAYAQHPNDQLASDFPMFAVTERGSDTNFVDFLKGRLTQPDANFAECFEAGVYRQDRNFVRQMAELVRDATAGPFELLDNQRLGLALCRAEMEKAIFRPDGAIKKTVIIIDGPPGSGKSVLAAKIWAALVTDTRILSGNFVLTTTSKAQETNWEHIFESVAQEHGGSGVVVAANKYAPDTIPGLARWMRRYPGKFDDPANWRMNCQLISELRGGYWMPDDHMLVSVVDEAHALINPEHSDARGQSGWPVNLGPQAYHIIRGSAVSIFLLDGKQSFRERESTITEDIINWAKELGAEVAPIISLAGSQFRCAGSKEYVDWLELLFSSAEAPVCADAARSWSEHSGWREEPDALLRDRKQLEFRFFDSPFDLESALREKIKAGFTSRLVAPFARKWITKKIPEPHDLPADMLDFSIEVNRCGRTQMWSRPWNVVPRGTDYTQFIQGRIGSRIYDDPLAEVGCPYAVRGFDFDFIGLLWLSDIQWRNNHWQVVPKNVHETGLTRTVSRARRETDLNGPHHQALLKKVLQAYRILLTRALRGVYIWFEDDLTRRHIRATVGLAD